MISQLQRSRPRFEAHSQEKLERHSLNILGTNVDRITRNDALRWGANFMRSFQRHHIITANSLLILEAQKNTALQKALNDASLVLPDSSGISWAALTLHFSKVYRFPGIDYAFELCGLAATMNIPVYLLGGKPGVAKKAARHLYRHYPKLLISGMRDGFFQSSDETTIIDDIAQSRARLVLLAMDMPQQEIWIHHRMPKLPPALYIGVGGSFDVWGDLLKRAPEPIRQAGFEWLYRWKQEPTRWKRMAQLPRFALRVIGKRF